MASTTLYATADSYTYEANPDTNYGSANLLIAGTLTDGNRRTYLKFDLSGIPPAVINSATLKLECYAVANLSAPDTNHQACRVADDSWTEGGIDWNNQPVPGAVEDTQTPAAGTISWDVTSWIQNEHANDQTASICIKCVTEDYDATSRYGAYRSAEYNGDDPQLDITYTPTGGGSPVTMHQTGHIISKIVRG